MEAILPAPVLQLEDVAVTYRRGDVVAEALRGISLGVAEGDFVAIHDP